MSNLIELEGITKIYPRGSELIRALDGVNLAVEEGEFLAIVGPSGSGKSTLMNVMGCLDPPTEGTVRIAGREINGLSEKERTKIRQIEIGFVFQQFFLLPTLTALENVLLPTLFSKRKNNARELLAMVGLKGREEHLPTQLSGGEMQRVAIARALVNHPRILLADEPTGNLDSKNAEAIFELFEKLNGQGQTVVVVTHNEELARRAYREVRLRDGKVLQ